MKVRIGESTSVVLNLKIFACDPPLSNPCYRKAAPGRRVRGSCDRMDIGWPTEEITFVARRVLASQLRP
jgi:hypothetical protein